MEREIKGVIFDLDGTIVDSMGMWRNLDEEFITGLGVEYNPQISKDIVGMTLEQAIEYFNKVLGLGKNLEEILHQWEEHLFYQYKYKIPLKHNVEKLIEKWHKNGIKLCVATLTEKELAAMVLERHGLIDKIEFILTVNEVGKSKLYPDIYLLSAEKMGLKPSECVVVEDSLHAMNTAKNAGFTVYAVDEETVEEKEKIHLICDRYIHDFSELI